MQMFQPYTLALLLLTPISDALAQTDLFGYDAKAPLDYQQKLLEERDGIKIFDASYAGHTPYTNQPLVAAISQFCSR